MCMLENHGWWWAEGGWLRQQIHSRDIRRHSHAATTVLASSHAGVQTRCRTPGTNTSCCKPQVMYPLGRSIRQTDSVVDVESWRAANREVVVWRVDLMERVRDGGRNLEAKELSVRRDSASGLPLPAYCIAHVSSSANQQRPQPVAWAGYETRAAPWQLQLPT